jgi:hypothetical protein
MYYILRTAIILMLLLLYALFISIRSLLTSICRPTHCFVDTFSAKIFLKHPVDNAHNHSCRHHTLSTQGQATGIQKHTPHTHRPNTQPEHQYEIIEKNPQQQKNAASSHIGEHHQASDRTRHGERKKREKTFDT